MVDRATSGVSVGEKEGGCRSEERRGILRAYAQFGVPFSFRGPSCCGRTWCAVSSRGQGREGVGGK